MTKTYDKRPTTKQELIALVKLWPKNTPDFISEQLSRNSSWVTSMVSRLRKAGVNLPKKARKGSEIDKFVAEIALELR